MGFIPYQPLIWINICFNMKFEVCLFLYMIQKIVVLDNGAYSIKVGLTTADSPKLIPNCVTKSKTERKRIFVGAQVDECKDRSALFYILPFQKGLLVNCDTEQKIWDYVFSKECLNVDCKDTCVVFTEPYFNFRAIQEATDEILFEDCEFQAVYRTTAGSLSAYQHALDKPDSLGCCVVVDSGYSFTHISPYCKGKLIKEGVIRTDIGGKVLTNQLKEWISYRQLQVMEETYVMNQCKEDACYVADDFNKHMNIAKKKGVENTLIREYVLPDFSTLERGVVRKSGMESKESEQILTLNHERFDIPELLFHPSDAGVNQMGVAEATVHSILSKCPENVQPRLCDNILLTGGSSRFPGFQNRMDSDIRALAPDLYDVKLTAPDNPINYAWKGGVSLTRSPNFKDLIVTKREYEEHGSRICDQRFTQ